MLTSSSGLVTDTYDYTAFGEELAHTGTNVNPFRYVGEQFDANSGFYNLRARLYNPENGRFTSVDPYEGDPHTAVSLHRYLYANASPATMSDPAGMFTFLEVWNFLSGLVNLPNIVPNFVFGKNNKKYRLGVYITNFLPRFKGDNEGAKPPPGWKPANFPADLAGNDYDQMITQLTALATARHLDFKIVGPTDSRTDLQSTMKDADFGAVIAHGEALRQEIFANYLTTDPYPYNKKSAINAAELAGYFSASAKVYIAACYAENWARYYAPKFTSDDDGFTLFPELINEARSFLDGKMRWPK
jgi:RHS repeat-associated protein